MREKNITSSDFKLKKFLNYLRNLLIRNNVIIFKKIFVFLVLFTTTVSAENPVNCEWNNREDHSCIIINKTPNTSTYSELGINKQIITKQDIINSCAIDAGDVLQLVSGLDVFQSGPKGQSTSIFTRGSESNHTLVLINGIAINDQSVTDGQHEFGQD